jgi:zinc transport system substrate-binding protein
MLYVKFVSQKNNLLMKKLLLYLLLLVIASCGQTGSKSGERIISVSIPPFKYFVETIGGEDFTVNVLVPAGANPHIYEPAPDQIANLRKSVAYISDGYLGFEMTWLDRFYETNKNMKKLSLGQNIDLIKPEENINAQHVEGADPHFWVSPKCALIIASDVKSLLTELNPVGRGKYETNYLNLVKSINAIDNNARESFSRHNERSFMIFHPTLGYLARDYGLTEIAVENEGKEPTPSSLKELIDIGKAKKIKTIFVQREYDTKNALAIASETGAVLEIIDPLNENWASSVQQIIVALNKSFEAKER